jgi:hypothetical protein
MPGPDESNRTVAATIVFCCHVPFVDGGRKISIFRVDLRRHEGELGEAAAEDDDGHVYAYSFPVWIKEGEPFPIKVGKASGDAEKRIAVMIIGSIL